VPAADPTLGIDRTNAEPSGTPIVPSVLKLDKVHAARNQQSQPTGHTLKSYLSSIVPLPGAGREIATDSKGASRLVAGGGADVGETMESGLPKVRTQLPPVGFGGAAGTVVPPVGFGSLGFHLAPAAP
jgi:hypothetical protein